MSSTRRITSCVFAGLFGALAGASGKWAFDQDQLQLMCRKFFVVEDDFCLHSKVCILTVRNVACPSNNIFQVVFVGRIVAFGCMVTFNLIMLNWFNRALQACETSVKASLLTTAANLLFTVSATLLFLIPLCYSSEADVCIAGVAWPASLRGGLARHVVGRNVIGSTRSCNHRFRSRACKKEDNLTKRVLLGHQTSFY